MTVSCNFPVGFLLFKTCICPHLNLAHDTDSISLFRTVSATAPQPVSTGNSHSPPRKSPQPRFIDIQVNDGSNRSPTPASEAVPTSQPFLTGNVPPAYSSTSSLEEDPLSSWVLSGFAENSNSHGVTPATTSNSPNTSSSTGLSPVLVGESKPNSDGSSSYVPPRSQDAFPRDSPTFIPPPSSNFSQSESFPDRPPYHETNARDIAFPPATMSNLAHYVAPTYDSSDWNGLNANDRVPATAGEERGDQPSRDYSGHSLRTGGNEGEWSNYTTWQGPSLESSL